MNNEELVDKVERMEALQKYLEEKAAYREGLMAELRSRATQAEEANQQLHVVINRLVEELGELYYQMSET